MAILACGRRYPGNCHVQKDRDIDSLLFSGLVEPATCSGSPGACAGMMHPVCETGGITRVEISTLARFVPGPGNESRSLSVRALTRGSTEPRVARKIQAQRPCFSNSARGLLRRSCPSSAVPGKPNCRVSCLLGLSFQCHRYMLHTTALKYLP